MTSTAAQRKQRHRARRLAMQALYQWYYNHNEIPELIANMLKEQGATKFDRPYFEALVKGCLSGLEEIDSAIQPVLDRDLMELNPVELAILRVSTYEMLHKIDVPYRVVINEGIELAKEYGSQDGHKYINGVLDKLAQSHRAVEFKA